MYTRLSLGLLLCIAGIVAFFMPHELFFVLLQLFVLYFLLNAIYLFYDFFKNRKRSDLAFALLSLAFAFFLTRYQVLPEWIIRVTFGAYCLLSALASFIQFVLNRLSKVRWHMSSLFFSILYLGIGLALLWVPVFPTRALMMFFGLYSLFLGIRYITDFLEFKTNNYEWKRKVRFSLPPILCAFLPEQSLNRVNKYLRKGEEFQLLNFKNSEDSDLKVMVFTGPVGLQKVGHCCLSYKGIVYSYGNYDKESHFLASVIGDGCFFTAPLDLYRENMLLVEQNSIFEYGIHLSKTQRTEIEKQIGKLVNNSYRWYCDLEKSGDYTHPEKYEEDYPNRLHYKTGAKFYKIKHGKFKYYWFLGDNCATFIDQILGGLGADILSMRGFISPGTYYDFLDDEFLKDNSPVISRAIFPAKIPDIKKEEKITA